MGNGLPKWFFSFESYKEGPKYNTHYAFFLKKMLYFNQMKKVSFQCVSRGFYPSGGFFLVDLTFYISGFYKQILNYSINLKSFEKSNEICSFI